MALSNVVAGNPAYASDVQQIINLLTGVMTDQQVTLSNLLTIQGDANNERIWIKTSQDGVIVLYRARGTISSPSAIQNGDSLGYYQLGGYDGAAFIRSAWITARAAESWNPSSRGTDLVFSVTPKGSTSMIDRAALVSDGRFLFTLNRQGGSSGSWMAAGATNYQESGVFVQCGSVELVFNNESYKSVTVTLPVPLSGDRTGLVFVSPIAGLAAMRIIVGAEIAVGSPSTQINVWGYRADGTNVTITNNVFWLVIGK